MTTPATIGARIKQLRQAQRPKMSQEALARELEVSWVTVSRLERGVGKRIDTDRLHDVAEVLGVTIGELLEDAA